jgi:UDP:flavonoid glycosyltransferase YjiC (YdhE family)
MFILTRGEEDVNFNDAHGVGEFVEIGHLTAERLAELIQRVRKNPSYRDRARYFQRVISQTQGLDLAADVIERAFKKVR